MVDRPPGIDAEADAPLGDAPADQAPPFDPVPLPATETFETMPSRRHRGHRRRRRRWPIVLLVIALVLVAAGGGAYAWARHQINPGSPGAQVQVTIARGTSTSHIADQLAHEGVISNADLFKVYLRLKHAGTIQAGDYSLRRNMSYGAVVAAFHKGPEVTVDRITIPEGFTLAQIADRVGKLPGRSAARFLELANSGQVRSQFEPPGSNNLEGLLYPDTYFLTPKDDEAAILRRMVTGFEQQASSLGLVDAAAKLNLTPYQVLTVASIVEREAKFDADRPKVASVIYNRLARHMKLGLDSTLLYGLHGDTAALNKDPNQVNPYNTRLIDGLPPTPISSPGAASLRAAMAPDQTDYVYFILADKDGHTAFAATSQEFDRLVAEAKKKGLL